MSDNPDPTPRPTLAPALLDTILLARQLHDEIHVLRELLHVAVNMLREQNHKLDSTRRQNEALRLELRSLTREAA